jgi:GrpB-like predicted nucleotidyltransferase (UPF0157 family)
VLTGRSRFSSHRKWIDDWDDVGVKDWPAWATEKIEVRQPDAAWQECGDKERLLLEATLRAWLVAPIEHIGSTAVPNLSAKPVLDFQAAVSNLDGAPDIATALAPAGWHYVPPELDAHAWRGFFVQVAHGRRVAHLHVMSFSNARWGRQVAFRDALRADPALIQRYAALKESLASQHVNDREAYTAGKADFIAAVLEEGGDHVLPRTQIP